MADDEQVATSSIDAPADTTPAEARLSLSSEDGEAIELLLRTLPDRVANPVREHGVDGLIEVVLDLGRAPTARYASGDLVLSEREAVEHEIEHVVAHVSQFGDDNRSGIPRTLHRISAMRNRMGRIIGLTLRVGRSVSGSAAAIRDLLEADRSVLLLGRPGVGKTTMLREAARILADDLGKRVVIVDTSNEIGGDGDIPHRAIGRARRMQVRLPELQHQVMIEAVENHTPEVIVIDEIGTSLEADAARTIAERGVQLIGTAHGNTLQNLMQNPTLSDLIGGIEAVTLGDDEARRRGTQKTVLERRAPPTFDALAEIQSFERVAIHHDIAQTVDLLLRGFETEAEVRRIGRGGEIESVEKLAVQRDHDRQGERRGPSRVSLPPAPGGPERRILPFGVSRPRLEQAIGRTRSAATVVASLKDADAVMTLRPYYRRRSGPLRDAESRGIPIYVLRNNTAQQMEQQLLAMRDATGLDPMTAALREAEDAVASLAFGNEREVELAPQSSYIRKVQHELATRHGQRSASRGREPYRRVIVTASETKPGRDLPWGDDNG